MKKISIVIPAYNEEKRIGNTLRKIVKYLKNKKYIYEIFVVDDCSKDSTAFKVESFIKKNKKIKIIKNKKNLGKGYSIKKGMLASKYPLILFSDSDLSTPIWELNKMIPFIEKNYDIVIASRNLKKSNIVVKQPFFRSLSGKIFASLVNITTFLGLKDTQCGFKLFKKDKAIEIVKRQNIAGWAFDVEILYIAKKLGYKIKEVPVTWINSEASKLNVFRDPLYMFLDLLKIRLNHAFGKYK